MRYRVGVLVALVVAVIGIAGGSPSHAACAAPTISVIPSGGQAGTQVTVEGRFFSAECRDTGQTEPSPPRRDIDVVFEQPGTSTILTQVDADDEYAFSVPVTIPIGAQPGPATVTARQDGYNAVAADLTVQALQPPPQRLPRTGRVSVEMVVIGTASVAIGLLLLWASSLTSPRRRGREAAGPEQPALPGAGRGVSLGSPRSTR